MLPGQLGGWGLAAFCNAAHCHLFATPVQIAMTPRDLEDMPWILAAFALVVVVIVGAAFFSWH
jgi:hypothetical protein